MRRFVLAALLLALTDCESNRRAPRDDEHVTAARALTTRYSQSRLARWKVKGSAAGADCGVLLVETSVILEDAMVAALHYGAGTYEIHQGGIQQFSRERAFRGVAYRDSARRTWTFGDVSRTEAASLVPCR
jgi:hypothetical protein